MSAEGGDHDQAVVLPGGSAAAAVPVAEKTDAAIHYTTPAAVSQRRGRGRCCRSTVAALVTVVAVLIFIGITLWSDAKHFGRGDWKLKKVHVDASSSTKRLRVEMDSQVSQRDDERGDWHNLELVETTCTVTSASRPALRIRADVRELDQGTYRTSAQVRSGSLEDLFVTLANPSLASSDCHSEWALDVFRTGWTVGVPHDFDGWSSFTQGGAPGAQAAFEGSDTREEQGASPSFHLEARNKKVRREASASQGRVNEDGDVVNSLPAPVVVGEANYRLVADFPAGTFQSSLVDAELSLEADLCYAEQSRNAVRLCLAAGSEVEKAVDANGTLHMSVPIMVSGRIDGLALSSFVLGSPASQDPSAAGDTDSSILAAMYFDSTEPDSALAALLGASHSVSFRNEAPDREPQLPAATVQSLGGGEAARRLTLPMSQRDSNTRVPIVRQHGFYLDDVGFAGFYFYVDVTDEYSLVDSSFHVRSPRTYLFESLQEWFRIETTWNFTGVLLGRSAYGTLSMDGEASNESASFDANYSGHETHSGQHHELNASTIRTSLDIINHDDSDLAKVDFVARINNINITVNFSVWEYEGVWPSYPLPDNFFASGAIISFKVMEADGWESLGDEEPNREPFFDAVGDALEDIHDSREQSMPGEFREQVDEAKASREELQDDLKSKVRDFLEDWEDFLDELDFEELREWWQETKDAWKLRTERLDGLRPGYMAQLTGNISIGSIDDSKVEVGTNVSLEGLCLRDKYAQEDDLCEGDDCCVDSILSFLKHRVEKGGDSFGQMKEVILTTFRQIKHRDINRYLDGGWDMEILSRFLNHDDFQPHILCTYRQPGRHRTALEGSVSTSPSEAWFHAFVELAAPADNNYSVYAVIKNNDMEPMLFFEGIGKALRDSEDRPWKSTFQVHGLTGKGRSWLEGELAQWSTYYQTRWGGWNPMDEFVDISFGPSAEKQASFHSALTYASPERERVEIIQWLVIENSNVLSVNRSLSVHSESNGWKDAFFAGAYFGDNFEESVFEFRGSTDQPIDGSMDFEDYARVIVNYPLTGQANLSLFDKHFLTLNMGVVGYADGEVMLYWIFRDGPDYLRLTSGSFEWMSQHREVTWSLKVEDEVRSRLWKISGNVESDAHRAAAMIYHDREKYPITAWWSDGFVQDDVYWWRENFTANLRMQMGVYDTKMMLALARSDYTDNGILGFDVQTTEREPEVPPALPPMPSVTAGFSASRWSLRLANSDADFALALPHEEDVANALATMTGLPTENVHVVFKNITVSTRLLLSDSVRYCGSEVASAVADVTDLGIGKVDVSSLLLASCERDSAWRYPNSTDSLENLASVVGQRVDVTLHLDNLAEAKAASLRLLADDAEGLLSTRLVRSSLFVNASGQVSTGSSGGGSSGGGGGHLSPVFDRDRSFGVHLALHADVQLQSEALGAAPDLAENATRIALADIFGDALALTLTSTQVVTCTACQNSDQVHESIAEAP